MFKKGWCDIYDKTGKGKYNAKSFYLLRCLLYTLIASRAGILYKYYQAGIMDSNNCRVFSFYPGFAFVFFAY